MKSESSLRNKVWLYLIIFSIAILAFLWFFQVVFLNGYYEWMKTNEIEEIATKIRNNYQNENFEELLDIISYNNEVCIETTNSDASFYSSISSTRGCLTPYNDIGLQYRKDFIESGKSSQTYKINNRRLHNKTIIYAMKIAPDYYAFINVSLEPIGSTTKILASQMVYVTIMVLVLSFFISYFVSKKISKPIVKLSDSAKKMSRGDYQVQFETGEDIAELNELASTLNQTKDTLLETDLLRRELLANVSHDLKTPLTMIRAYAEMVRDLTYDHKEKRNQNLNTIIEETDRLTLLVNDILDLSKMQTNNDGLMLEEFDLHDLIQSILKRFLYLSEKEGYMFVYQNQKAMFVKADKKKMEQVIYNLIINAVNYVGDDKQIIIEATITRKNYHIAIIDHGKGIEEKELKYIWDKYYKSDKKYKRNAKGTGLGLSIVKNILELHHSSYGVISNKGKGTIFYFNMKPISKRKEKMKENV